MEIKLHAVSGARWGKQFMVGDINILSHGAAFAGTKAVLQVLSA